MDFMALGIDANGMPTVDEGKLLVDENGDIIASFVIRTSARVVGASTEAILTTEAFQVSYNLN